MKIILDSNVIISALAARGLCNAIFELCIERHELFITYGMIDEIISILKNKLKANEKIINEFQDYLKEFFTILEDQNVNKICRDRDDDKILSAAINNELSYIITGDNDLLVLEKIENIKIVNSREFWEISKEDFR